MLYLKIVGMSAEAGGSWKNEMGMGATQVEGRAFETLTTSEHDLWNGIGGCCGTDFFARLEWVKCSVL
jgi:hypothetical protein